MGEFFGGFFWVLVVVVVVVVVVVKKVRPGLPVSLTPGLYRWKKLPVFGTKI